MTLRMCLLVAGAGALLQQAALGCRHHRPSFGEGAEPPYAAALEGRPRGVLQAAAFAQGKQQPAPGEIE